ncbi:MAG TPA: hypothetical protein VF928_09180 [Usitatibacteraceae bacterium]
MKYLNRSVNQIGRQEIAAFLLANHKKGESIHDVKSCIDAWVEDAEFHLAQGNQASIEIRSWDAVSGRTENFEISDAGLDIEEVEIDE